MSKEFKNSFLKHMNEKSEKVIADLDHVRLVIN